jgi:L-asparaginase II
MAPPPQRVLFSRAGLTESAHALVWCAVDADGTTLAESDEDAAELAVFPRSAVKPLQALPAVRDGVLEHFELQSRHLAMACASHGGHPIHTQTVGEVLAACGLDDSFLGCGPSDPRDLDEMDARRSRNELPAKVVHNCSGKHALALARCVYRGWDPRTYLEPSHPIQKAMHASVAASAGRAPSTVPFGGDGCGMLAFQIPLGALARAFGRLASGDLGPGGDQVADAMRDNPELVAFDGALDTELMRAGDGLVAKIGAEGVLAVGLPDGRGLALKVADGAMRALDVAGPGVVREVLELSINSKALEGLAHPVMVNSRGEAVGAGRAVA